MRGTVPMRDTEANVHEAQYQWEIQRQKYMGGTAPMRDTEAKVHEAQHQ